MTAASKDYSLSLSSFESSARDKLAKDVIRLKDLKDLGRCDNRNPPVGSALLAGPRLSLDFFKKLYESHQVYEEAEQMQYHAAELQGQLQELQTMLSQMATRSKLEPEVAHHCKAHRLKR